jgi:hypothetical protein
LVKGFDLELGFYRGVEWIEVFGFVGFVNNPLSFVLMFSVLTDLKTFL